MVIPPPELRYCKYIDIVEHGGEVEGGEGETEEVEGRMGIGGREGRSRERQVSNNYNIISELAQHHANNIIWICRQQHYS